MYDNKAARQGYRFDKGLAYNAMRPKKTRIHYFSTWLTCAQKAQLSP